MKTSLILLITLLFLFSGCVYVNERGVDTNYYNTCKEYYDSMGVYHKTCDKNAVEFEDVKTGAKTIVKVTKDAITDSYNYVKQEVQ